MKFRTLTATAVLIATLGFVESTAHAAGLLSGTVTVSNNGPDKTTIAYPCAGCAPPETGPTTGTVYWASVPFTFTDNTITMVNPYDSPYGLLPPPGSFNGFQLVFSGIPKISGVTQSPANTTNNSASNGVSWSANTVWVNFNGLPRYTGETSVFNVSFSAVPEPVAWALLMIGLGTVGIGLRSRRRTRQQSPGCCTDCGA